MKCLYYWKFIQRWNSLSRSESTKFFSKIQHSFTLFWITTNPIFALRTFALLQRIYSVVQISLEDKRHVSISYRKFNRIIKQLSASSNWKPELIQAEDNTYLNGQNHDWLIKFEVSRPRPFLHDVSDSLFSTTWHPWESIISKMVLKVLHSHMKCSTVSRSVLLKLYLKWLTFWSWYSDMFSFKKTTIGT